MREQNHPNDHGTRLNLYEDGVQVGTVVYDWIQNIWDLYRCEFHGVKTTGEVLFLSDLEILEGGKKRIFRLKRLLPPAHFLCGLKNKTHLVAPYGLPKMFWE